jgi:hypothetical protein
MAARRLQPPPPQEQQLPQQAFSQFRLRVVLALACALVLGALYVRREENALQLPAAAQVRGGAGDGAGLVFVLEPSAIKAGQEPGPPTLTVPSESSGGSESRAASPLEGLRARLREHALQSQPDASPTFLSGVRWLYETHGALLYGEWEHDPGDPLRPLSVVVSNLGPSTFNASELVLVASIFGPEQLAVELSASGPSSWRGELARPSRCGEFRLDLSVVQFRGGAQFEFFDRDSGCSEPNYAEEVVFRALKGRLEGDVLAEFGTLDPSGTRRNFRHNDNCACHLWCYRTPRCVASVFFDSFEEKDGEFPPPHHPRMCRLLSSLAGREVRLDIGLAPEGVAWASARSYLIPDEAVANETRRWQQSVTLDPAMNYVDIRVPPGASRLMGFPKAFARTCLSAPPSRAQLRPCRDADMARQPAAWAALDCPDRPKDKDPRCVYYHSVFSGKPSPLLWPEPAQCEYRLFDADAQQRCRDKLNATRWLWVGDSLMATWRDHVMKQEQPRGATHTWIGNNDLPRFPSLNQTSILIYDWEVVHKIWRRRTRERVERDFLHDLRKLDKLQLPHLSFFLLPLPIYGEREPGDTYSRSRWISEFMRPLLRDRGFRFVDLQQYLPVMANRTRRETLQDDKTGPVVVYDGK